MNEASGAGEKRDAPPTPTIDASATADAKATPTEGETPVKEQSLVENEAKEAKAAAGEVTDEAAGEPMNVDKAKSPAQPTQAVETKEVEGGVESTSPEPTPGSSSAPDDPLASRLAKVVKSGSKSAADTSSTPESAPKDASESALSTKTLLSVLEDSFDKEQTDVAEDAAKSQPQAAASQESTPASQSVSESSQSVPESSTSQPVPESSTSQSAPSTQQSLTDLPPPKMNRKYIYKLKSKTGKVLKYVSSVPIVLKRPVISLTKMEQEEESDTTEEEKTEATGKAARTEAEDVDSDNSTKENNVKANDASKGVVGPRIARKRGRPPLLQKAPVITLDDSPSPDPVTEAKEPFKSVASGSSTPSYGVQTRKRQLKFLPDGRVVTPAGKKYKSAAAAAAAAVAAAASSSKALEESSDTDVLTESDDGSQSDRKTKKLPVATKKVTPVDRKVLEKKGSAKKVFDYESCFRENSTPEAKDAKQSVPAKKVVETPKSTPKPVNPPRSTPVTTKAAATPTNNSATSTPTPKNTVDPAQLLSSLIGVSIFPHQLNVVKFKPKVIQDRKTMSAQKNVTFVDETSNKKSSAASQPQQPRNSSFRANAKPSLQKILPKPLSTPDRFVYFYVCNFCCAEEKKSISKHCLSGSSYTIC